MGLFGKKKTEDKSEKKADAIDKKKGASAAPKMKDLYGGKTVKAVKKQSGSKSKSEVVTKRIGNAYKHLVKPLITEKAANLATENKYAFEVGIKSNKIEIAKAIEEVYGVKPSDVNIIRVAGKKVRSGRVTGTRKDWKKAIITLPKDKSINIYEGV